MQIYCKKRVFTSRIGFNQITTLPWASISAEKSPYSPRYQPNLVFDQILYIEPKKRRKRRAVKTH